MCRFPQDFSFIVNTSDYQILIRTIEISEVQARLVVEIRLSCMQGAAK